MAADFRSAGSCAGARTHLSSYEEFLSAPPIIAAARACAARPIEDIKEDKKGWLRHGVAALAVSVLGLGVAGSVVLTGAAQHTTSGRTPRFRPTPAGPRTRPAVIPPARPRSREGAESCRPARGGTEQGRGRCRRSGDRQGRQGPRESPRFCLRRDPQAGRPDRHRQAGSAAAGSSGTPAPAKPDAGNVKSGGKTCLPVTRGYSIAARFGQVGPGRATTLAWTFPPPSAPRCTLRPPAW